MFLHTALRTYPPRFELDFMSAGLFDLVNRIYRG